MVRELAIEHSNPTNTEIVSIEMRIRHLLHETPVMRSRSIDSIAGRSVFLKAEHLQKTGSFKARGALAHMLALAELPDTDRPRGVVAASSGNHGQAVAWAAGTFGLTATIVVSEGAQPVKKAAIREYGGKIEVVVGGAGARLTKAEEIAQRDKLAAVPPYDHATTIAGQGTWVLEALRQIDTTPRVIVVPVGGGGLAAGTAIAALATHRLLVVGVEPEGADDTRRSLLRGRRIRVRPRTIADALMAETPGEMTFEINRRLLSGIVTVTDDEILLAQQLLWERAKQVVEPSGAASLAAVLARKVAGDEPALVFLSGGNAAMSRSSIS